MRRNFILAASLVLVASWTPAARAAATAAPTMLGATLGRSIAAAAHQPWEIGAPSGDTGAERQLPQRFAERGGAKIGAALGLAVGGSVGFALFGTPGAALFGTVGALFGEVLGEFSASTLFNPRRTPYPQMNGPLLPVR